MAPTSWLLSLLILSHLKDKNLFIKMWRRYSISMEEYLKL